jgi:aminoglycoside phosphotransferase (APT) family kinase protein
MSFVRLSAHLLFQATKLALPPAFCPQYRHGGAFMANEEHLHMTPVWEADWVVTSAQATSLIETSFPTLAPVSVEAFGVGWDNTAFLVSNSFVFRFPRRRIAVALMETEIRLLPWLFPQLTLPIPNPCYVGAPSAGYPCVFAGYPLIPGRTLTATDVTDEERRTMARPLAHFLAALHSVSPDEARSRGASGDPIRRLDAARHKSRAIDRLNTFTPDLMPRDLGARIRLLLDTLPTIEAPSINTLVHGDLHASQILVTDETHELAGVIDWGDLHLGDPASDFAGVHSMLPRDCHEDFIQTYGPVDPLSWSAAKGRAIWHTIAVLAQAADVGDKPKILEAQSCFARLAEE